MLAAAVWHNVLNPVDVNRSGIGSPLDALVVINELARTDYSDPATGQLDAEVPDGKTPPFFDVNCDGLATPRDALYVINKLDGYGYDPAFAFSTSDAISNTSGSVLASGCHVKLTEGDSLRTEVTTTLTLSRDSQGIRLLFDSPQFDASASGAMQDAFEVTVTGDDGKSVTQSFLPGRDAALNWSEQTSAAIGASSTITVPADPVSDPHELLVNLSHLPAGTEVDVTARLINNDGDTTSSVVVRDMELVFGLDDPSGVYEFAEAQFLRTTPVQFDRLEDITGSVVPSYGRTSYTPDRSQLMTDLVVTNRFNQAVTGDMIVVLDRFTEIETAVLRPDGLLADGRPYFDLTSYAEGPLLPGESTRPREISFTNPGDQPFSYRLSTLGALNTAPESFVSSPLTRIEADRVLTHTFRANDPDGDDLDYSVVAGPDGMAIDPDSGVLNWRTHIDDVGRHSYTVRATDPYGLSIESQYEIEVMTVLQNRPPTFVTDPVTEAIASSGFEITTVAVGEAPAGVSVVNGFLGPRIVTANSADQTVGVYAGENNDRFDDATEYSTGQPQPDGSLIDVGYSVDVGLPEFLATDDSNGIIGMDQGDINGDGILDFVTTFVFNTPAKGLQYQWRITATLGDGDGGFLEPIEVFQHNIGHYSYDIRNLLLRDFNNDGALDIVLAERRRSPRLITLLGNGDGTFGDAVEQSFDKVVSDFRTADIDEDGFLDLVGRTAVLGFGASYQAMWMRGGGDGTFGEPVTIGSASSDPNCCYQTKARPYDVVDLNGDDHLDVVLIGVGADIQIYHGDGAGNFSLEANFDAPGSVRPYNWVRAADFSGDGLIDVLYDEGSDELGLLIGDGTGVTFTNRSGASHDAWLTNYAGGDDPVDVDADGDLDLVFGTASGDQISPIVAINDGSGNFTLTQYAMFNFLGHYDERVSSGGDIVRGAMFGDYNRDGVIDYSYFTSGSDFNGVGIRLGTRPGEFGSSLNIPRTASGADWNDSESHAADFDGDGDLDLLSLPSGRVFLGTGDGTFADPIPAISVARPGSIGSIADFNLDGLPDFVATRANTHGSRYYAALANGDGTFTVSDDKLAENSFYGYSATKIADFNNDGYPDFIAKATIEKLIDVHLNDPNDPGVFSRTYRLNLPGGSQGINASHWDQSFAVSDFTGDGIVDLLFAARESGEDTKIVVHAGDGLGGFSFHSELFGYDEDSIYGIFGGSYYEPGDFAVGDIDEDGDLDLVSTTTYGPRTFLNNGTGEFSFFQFLPNSGNNQRGIDTHLVDFDEDGHLDLILSSENSGPLNIRRGKGDGTFHAAQRFGVVGRAAQLSIADVDQDGRLDLVHRSQSWGYGPHTVSIMSGKRDGLVDLLAVDLNADGNEEILGVNEQMDRLQILVGDNLGTFSRLPDLLTGRAPRAVAAADLDGDGQLELITANRADRSLTVFSGSIADGYSAVEFNVPGGPIDVEAVDIDGDGHVDVVALDDLNHALWVFSGNGSTTLDAPTAIALGDRPTRLTLADANGNGALDAIVTLADSNRVMILPSVGVQPAAAPLYVSLTDSPSDVAVVDLNDDGNPDLAVTLPGASVLSVLYGLGNNQFAKPQHIQLGQQPTRVTIADADKDGRPDLIVGNHGDATASVIYNRFDPNEVYRYDSDAVDPDDDVLTYAIVDGPGGLIINPQTGELLWAASPDQVGIHEVMISSDDGAGGVATQSFQIDVQPARENHSPLIATEPATAIGAEDSFSYQVAALDQDRNSLRYRLIDGPEGAVIDPTTGLLEWDARPDGAVGLSLPGFGYKGRIAVPADASLESPSITVEGWYNFSQLPASNGASIVFQQTNEYGNAYQFWLRGTNQLGFEAYLGPDYGSNNGLFRRYFPFEPQADRWYHFALTIDDQTQLANIFVDGQLFASEQLPGPIVHSGHRAQVGHTGTSPMRGRIDNYRVWNVARTPEQIQEGIRQQYENDPTLVLDYRFEFADTNTVIDHSSANNTGYRVGSSLVPQWVEGLATPGMHSFTVQVEDGRGGFDEQTFELEIAPELRGSIVGHLFDDLDGDGVQDDGSENPAESSLQDWHLYIDVNGNAYPNPGEPKAITDANGDYRFENLLPGSYPIRVSPVAGYDVPKDAIEFAVSANQETAFDVAIRQLSLSHVRGQLRTEDGDAIAYWKVFADLDEDGTRGDDEPMAMSDRRGNYALTGLAAGDYTIRPDLPAGWADVAGPDGLEVNVVVDSVLNDNDFTLAPTNTSVTGGVHFVTTPPSTIEARQVYRYASVAYGILDTEIAYDLSLAPEGMTVDPIKGLVAWRPTIDQVGQHTVILRATTDDGSISLHDFDIHVSAPNSAPAITQLPSPTGYLGINHSYDVVAQDPEQESITYSLIGEDHSATIDSNTGHFEWLPTLSGAFDFTVRVADASGASTDRLFTVNVEATSPVVALGDLTGPRSNFPVTQRSVTQVKGFDSIGRKVEWSIDSGPDGLTLDASGVMTWTPTASQLGEQSLSLTATAADGQTFAVPLVLSVVGALVNATPVVSSQPTRSAVIDREYQYDIIATDVDGDPLSFALLNSPPGMSIDPRRGTIRWTPASDQVGETEVLLRVADTYGAETSQAFTIHVSRTGGPPVIKSFPDTEASVGVAYFYSIVASDAEADPMAYRLLSAPAGMTIAESTGEITWTPTIAQLGQQTAVIEVSDGIGGAATQAFAILVRDGVPNSPPTIGNAAPRFAAVGEGYQHAVAATDPEATTLAYSLSKSPIGMTIDALSGQIDWTPIAGQDGKHVVTIRVVDAGGAAAIESFEVDVLAQNTAPVIDSTAPLDVAAGAEFMYDVLAGDVDLDRLEYQLVASPAGASIDSFGRIRWQTSVAEIGDHDFEIRVNDPRGGEDSQSFALSVIEDLIAPKLSLIENQGYGSRNILPWQGPFKVYVKAVDNVAVASLTLQANGQDIPLDAVGTATFTFEEWGFALVDATATAIDTNGNVTTKTITFGYTRPFGWSGTGTEDIPTAVITSPADTESVVGMVSIVGTAAHDDFASYTLSYRHIDETDFTEILQSSTPVTAGELGVWDTSLLINDEYVIRLEVETTDRVQNVVEHNVGLGGELKLGNFQLSFTDMVIPVAGIPIEITRVYDTLQADRQGDFGYGWRLEYRDTDLRVGLPKSGLEDIGIYTPMREGVKVYLNVPGQGRQGFTFTPDIRVLPGFGGNNLIVGRPRFTPDPGVTSTLSTGVNGYLTVNEQGELFAPGNIPYNPASPSFGGAYVVTTRDGIQYRVDGATGKLVSADDRNQNRLTFTNDGIKGNDGEFVEIDRDQFNRISEIADREGNRLRYSYGASGNLSEVLDRTGNVTSFQYRSDFEHYLETVTDPLGRVGSRSQYDDQGRVVSVQNVGGHSIVLTHEIDNSIERLIDKNGNSEFLEYDGLGRVVSRTDALGGTHRYEFDANGYLSSETNAQGGMTRYLFSSSGDMLERTDPSGRTFRYTYNQFGYPTSTTNPAGDTTVREYDLHGNLIRIVDSLGNTQRFEHDQMGNVVRVEDMRGNVTSALYDSSGNQIASSDPFGNTTEYQYDLNGQKTGDSITLGVDSQSVTLTSSRILDANGQPVSTTDANGDVFDQTFNGVGDLVELTNQAGRTTKFSSDGPPSPELFEFDDGSTVRHEFDANNNLISTTDQNGNVERFEYNALNQMVVRILPDSTSENLNDNPRYQYEYDSIGQRVAEIDPLGRRTEWKYDLSGNLVLQTDPDGNLTEYRYDLNGNLSEVIDRLGRKTTLSYDSAGRQISIEYSDQSSESFEYDASGNLVRRTNPNGQETRFEFDAADRLATVIDALGNRTEMERDAFGNVILIRDANQRESQFEYDGVSQQTAVVRPSGDRSETVYGPDGFAQSVTDYEGRVTRYEYDEVGRLAKTTFDDGSSTTYQYDAVGNRTGVTDERGTTSFEFDSQNRLVTRIEVDGTQTDYTYDAVGNLIAFQTPFGVTRYEYDQLNRISVVESPDSSETTYEYDAEGQWVLTTLPNGLIESREYDVRGRLLNQNLRNLAGQTLESIEFDYDANGNVIRETYADGDGSQYSFDANNRLIEEQVFDAGESEIQTRYEYDAVGNLLSKSSGSQIVNYQYDQNDRLTVERDGNLTTTFTYDRNGNLTNEVRSDGKSKNYSWDLLGRLDEAIILDSSGTRTIEYGYDADGYRVTRTEDSIELHYLWAHLGKMPVVVAEYQTSGEGVVQYARGNDLLSQTRNGETHSYHVDVRGSVYALSDETGQLVNEYRYDAYGNPVETIESVENHFQFTGEPFDNATGLTYLRARYLDNERARFISVDPFAGRIEDPQSLHRYQYAHQNPTIYVDPTGESSELAKMLVSFSVKATMLGVMAAGLQQVWSHAVGGTPVGWSGVTLSGGFGGTQGVEIGNFASIGATGGVGAGVSGLISTPFTKEGETQTSHGVALWHLFANAGIAASLNLEGEGGIGGISVDVPGAQWLKNLGMWALTPTYAILGDANVSAGVGRSKGAVLWMGFGRGNAAGRSVGASLGVSLTFVGGTSAGVMEGPAGSEAFGQVRSILGTLA